MINKDPCYGCDYAWIPCEDCKDGDCNTNQNKPVKKKSNKKKRKTK